MHTLNAIFEIHIWQDAGLYAGTSLIKKEYSICAWLCNVYFTRDMAYLQALNYQ